MQIELKKHCLSTFLKFKSEIVNVSYLCCVMFCSIHFSRLIIDSVILKEVIPEILFSKFDVRNRLNTTHIHFIVYTIKVISHRISNCFRKSMYPILFGLADAKTHWNLLENTYK